MSVFPVNMNLSGTTAGLIVELRQQIADLKQELAVSEDARGSLELEIQDLEARIEEAEALAEITPEDPEPDQDEVKEVDDAEVYDDKIRDKARILELESALNKVTLESQMTIRGLKWDNVELRCENKDLREEVEVVTKERDSATATMLRERAAHLKAKDGVTSGRVTKDKSKAARHAGALTDNITLALRQKEGNGRT